MADHKEPTSEERSSSPTNLPATPPPSPLNLETHERNYLNFLILAPLDSEIAVHPSGNGYVISHGVTQILIQAQHVPSSSRTAPSQVPLMTCNTTPILMSQIPESHTAGPSHQPPPEPVNIPIPPPIARPYTSFRCPVTGKWFLMYRQSDCPEYFSLESDWK